MTAGLRTAIVLIPCVALLFYLGALIGNGDYLLPILTVIVVFAAFILKAVTAHARFEASTVGFLLIGYLVGNRGFAELSVVKPLYVGELALAAIALVMLGRYFLTREILDLSSSLSKLILVYFFYALLRFAFDVTTYGLDAVRDFAMVYYSAFFFIAYHLASRPVERKFIRDCLVIAFIGQGFVAIVITAHPEWFYLAQDSETYSFLAQKGDLVATFTGAGIFFLYSRERIFGSVWSKSCFLFILFGTIATSIARSGIAALVITSILMLVAHSWRFFLYPMVLSIAGLLALLISTTLFEVRDQDSQIAHFQDKAMSIFDYSGTRSYQSDLGEMKADNNNFRREFWESTITETTEDNALIGKGFGYDFLPRFELFYGKGSWEGLRSPHNYFVTVYGRMGLVGLVIFLGITLQIVRLSFREASKVRRGEANLEILAYWCGACALLIAAAVGVVIEGPMGGIIFWTLLGLALANSKANDAERATARRLTPGKTVSLLVGASAFAQGRHRRLPSHHTAQPAMRFSAVTRDR